MINRKYKINNSYFEKINTEEKSYLLGLLFADGHNDVNRSTITLALRDKEHIEKIRKILYPMDDRPIYTIELSKQNKNWSDSYRLVICCKQMSDDLLELGMVNNKSFTIKIPNEIDNVLIPHFIRGYFDGDGYFSEYKNKKDCVVGITGNKMMLNQFQEILEIKCGIHKTKMVTTSSSKNGIFKIQYGGIKNTNKIYKFIYENATIWLERKRNKMKTYYSKYETRLNHIKTSKYQNVCFDKIRNKWWAKNIFTGKQKRFINEDDAYDFTLVKN